MSKLVHISERSYAVSDADARDLESRIVATMREGGGFIELARGGGIPSASS